MAWIARGLRDGVVTTRYPRRPDGYAENFRGALELNAGATSDPSTIETLNELCPTKAFSSLETRLVLDQGKCVLCGRCVEVRGDLVAFSPRFETATNTRVSLRQSSTVESDEELEQVRSELALRVKSLRRSIHVRHLDAGSDGSDEWEVAALTNPVYDVQRLGIYFTASPRHADILLVTGLGSVGMAEPLRETYEAMAHPKVVIATGVDAISGGLLGEGYASNGGVTALVPVDVFVPGSPASPFSLLHALLTAVNLIATVSP